MKISEYMITVRKSIGIFLTFVFLGIGQLLAAKTTNNLTPDFAFPEEVEMQSREKLDEALAKKNFTEVFREMMNVCIAKNLKDPEAYAGNINFIDSVIPEFPMSYKSLARLLEARITADTYDQGRYIYDNRQFSTSGEWPQDPMEWSGDMFKERILSLIDMATKHIEDISGESLNEFKSLLSFNDEYEKDNLSLQDFILFSSVNILKRYGGKGSEDVIPFYSYTEPSDESFSGKINTKLNELLQDIIEISANKKNSYCEALAIREKAALMDPVSLLSLLSEYSEKLKGEYGEGLILYSIWEKETEYKDYDGKKLYGKIKSWLEKFHKGPVLKMVEYAGSLMSEERIQINLKNRVLPHAIMEGKAEITNLDMAYLLVFRLSENQYNLYDGLILNKFPGGQKPVQIIELKTEYKEEVPFLRNVNFEIPGLDPGLYVAIPSKSKSLPKNWKTSNSRISYNTFRVTSLSLVTNYSSSEKNSGRLYVVEAASQKPVKGAKVKYYLSGNKKAEGILFTDSEGAVTLPEGYMHVEASYGASVVRGDVGINYYKGGVNDSDHLEILTNLSLYHPGDSIVFSVIGWRNTGRTKSLIRNEEISIVLHDANYSESGKLALRLDEDGRTNGKLIIPEGKLLGKWTLSAALQGKEGKILGSSLIEVSDYKLPGFFVKLEKDSSVNYLAGDIIKFKGTAETYSGLPVTNSEVSITVDYNPFFRGFPYYGSSASYHTSALTDGEGVFFIELPTANLRNTYFEHGRYTVSASVVSASGEKQTSSPLIFVLGESHQIRLNLPETIKAEGDEISIRIPVYDMLGLPEKTKVEYQLLANNSNRVLSEGFFESPVLNLSVRDIPSGRYLIKVKCPDQEEFVSGETVLYRPDEKKVPYATPLWAPQKEYYFKEGKKNVSIKAGSYWPGSWLLCVVSDSEKILERRWIECDSAILNINIDIPDNDSFLFVNLSGMHDFERKNEKIEIIPSKSLEKLDVSVNTFRENITAGSKENWSFGFKIGEVSVSKLAGLAVMTDKALNSIFDFKWNLNIPDYKPYSRVQTGGLYSSFNGVISVFNSTIRRYPSMNFIPGWETYGYSLGGWLRNSGPILYRTAGSRGVMADGVETAQMKLMSNASATMDFAEAEDESVELQAVTTEEDATQSTPSEIRPVEMPVAFFMPDLKGDERGNINIDFTVPDFNTTWQFQLIGYTPELFNASLVLDAMASKPVMVKSNLPQYLLTGDKATISALVFNNTGEECELGGKIIIENPVTGEILTEKEFLPMTTGASDNRLISLRFDVPDNLVMLRVKSYAISGENSDGEQGYIPIYPSSTPVVDAITFYLSSKQEISEIKIPKLRDNANVTLKYCDNPIWDCLLSLPSLWEDNSENALSLASSIYANRTGCNILDKNPLLKTGLTKLLESSDTILTLSNLMKDTGLKISGLSMTPWVNNARNEKERIGNLSSLLDSDKINERLTKDIDGLQKLQNSDGGWSWFEGMKSSGFITMEILRLIGYIGLSGEIPEVLNQMAERGISYYDRLLVSSKERKFELPVESTMDYLYIRSFFSFGMNPEMKKIEKECMEKISANWRYWGIGEKAKSAIVLSHNNKYKSESVKILESIEQFADKSESKGWSFPTSRFKFSQLTPIEEESLALAAFKEILPESAAVEGISQWLILQKETEDWGRNFRTAGIIASLLTNYSASIGDRGIPVIKANGKVLRLSETEAITGSYTLTLNPRDISGKRIQIERESGIPAWGGIISQYISPINEVKKSKTGELSVEKKLYKVVDGKKTELKSTDEIKQGDKLSVVLTIDCKKEMDYVAIIDNRGTFMQPDEWVSGYRFIDGIGAYQEIRSDRTSFFIETLPIGKFIISYDCNADREGTYSVGIVQVQSQYSPMQAAHSQGMELKIGD
ncbi:MAG: hypothetical protein J1E95_07480 [Muribaculaceae bacterium]|nr:hypothetical protein [Muribaculaceae bacterium]